MQDNNNNGSNNQPVSITVAKANVIDRLFTSFAELEVAIESAKKTLIAKGNPPEAVLSRLNSYDSIMAKQRKYAQDLCIHINRGDWEEVSRAVTIINGLSVMIRDDARAVLISLSARPGVVTAQQEEDISHFC